jgi:hypothetical protein
MSADDLLCADHPHIGVVEKGKLPSLFSILRATNRKLYSFNEAHMESVALHVDPSRFILSIGKSFILLTLQEGRERRPVIKKSWRRIERQVANELTLYIGDQDTYMDADNLKWVHRYNRPGEPDELSGYDSEGKEVLLLTF